MPAPALPACQSVLPGAFTSRPRIGSDTPDGAAPVARRTIRLHGHQVTYLETGEHSGGPAVVFLHGLASSSSTWLPALELLGHDVHAVAPDLLGHGESAKPCSGDYSLRAYATGLRDLIVALGLDRVTVVGHSFGGGVAMQFAYQFSELTERLVLVASGGLGREVSHVLRAAGLPGTALVLRTLPAMTPSWLRRLTHTIVRLLPGGPAADVEELGRAWVSFTDSGARGAFVQTVRSTLDGSGQRLDGTGRLYLLADTPVLLVAGARDAVIPVAHSEAAHQLLPGSRLQIFDRAGHFPHSEQPGRFADVLVTFLATSSTQRADRTALRRRLLDPSTSGCGR